MHPAAFYYGKILNATHFEGDDPQAVRASPPALLPDFATWLAQKISGVFTSLLLQWTYPYFPHTDTTVGMNSDCVQLAVEPCPGPNVSDPSSKPLQHITDLEHPDGKIASWGVDTIANFSRAKIGMGGANKPFFLGVGLHKPHLPHIVPQKYFDLYPDVGAISLPPNMNVPEDFPTEAWSPSGEVRSYPDMGANFPAAGFSEHQPPALVDIRHLRRGYYAAASFTDANIGRVINALTAAGPEIADNTISLLWSDREKNKSSLLLHTRAAQ